MSGLTSSRQAENTCCGKLQGEFNWYYGGARAFYGPRLGARLPSPLVRPAINQHLNPQQQYAKFLYGAKLGTGDVRFASRQPEGAPYC